MANTQFWQRAAILHVVREESKFPSLETSVLKRIFPNGLPRGIVAEVNGRRSSGRTSVCLHLLAQATRAGEICAIVDLHDSFHPTSACGAGVRLDRLLWVRCRGNAEHAIRATDLLLHAGGFGVVLLDLCEANAKTLNRIPLSYWYRFRRAIEHTPTILLICAESSQAKSCSSSSLALEPKPSHWSGKAPFLLLRGLRINAILRKLSNAPPQPLSIQMVA